MTPAIATDIGAFIKGAIIGAGTATAGGTGDATKVTGQTIDRDNFFSASIMIAYKAVLAEDETISFAVERQESDDGTTWDTAVDEQTATVAATGATGGSTEYGTVKIDVNLTAQKRYVRYNVTPNLSASGTDTLVWAGEGVLGGARSIPTT